MPSMDFVSEYLDPEKNTEPASMRAALQAAVDAAAREQRDLVIARRRANYRIDGPIDFRNAAGVRVILDGVIENVRPGREGVDRLFPHQAVFKLGNHHPVNWNRRGDTRPSKMAGLAFVRAGSVKAGGNALRVDYPATWTVGDIVFIRSDAFFAGAREHERPDFVLLARVERLEPGRIVIDRAFDEDVERPLVALAASDVALDLEGAPLFVADRVVIEGQGGLHTQGNFLARSATFECQVALASGNGASAFYGSCFSASAFCFDHVVVDRKIADISGGSHQSTFSATTVTYRGAGGGVSALVIGENSRDNLLTIDRVEAPDFAENTFIRITAARRNRIEIGSIVAPKVRGSAVMLGRAEDDGANRCLHNTITVRQADFGSELSQFVRTSASVGTDSGNRVADSDFRGRPTRYAATSHDKALIGAGVSFEAGDVVVTDRRGDA